MGDAAVVLMVGAVFVVNVLPSYLAHFTLLLFGSIEKLHESTL